MSPAETIHATTVASAGRAVLMTGPSGTGKSDLALRLIDRGFTLSGNSTLDVNAPGTALTLGSCDSSEVPGTLTVTGGAGSSLAVGQIRIVEGAGVHAPAGEVTPEFVAAHWAAIADESKARAFDSAGDALMGAFAPPARSAHSTSTSALSVASSHPSSVSSDGLAMR